MSMSEKVAENFDREFSKFAPKAVRAGTNNGTAPVPTMAEETGALTRIQGVAWDTSKLPWMEMKAYAAAVVEKYEGEPKPDVVKLADALAQWAAGVDVTPK